MSSGFVVLYPAWARSRFASSGSYFGSKDGRPNHSLVGTTTPFEASTSPEVMLASAGRLIARLAARRIRMSFQGDPSVRLNVQDQLLRTGPATTLKPFAFNVLT